jgi:hypothetical protein
MTQPEANLEYVPEQRFSGVSVRTSGQNASITIRMDGQRVLQACSGPAVSWLCALILFYGMYWRHRGVLMADSWRNLVVPGLLAAGALLQTLVNFLQINFPITLELDETQLILRWRTLKSMHSLAWKRSSICGISTERLQPKNRLSKRAYLVLHIAGQGNVGIASTTRKQMEFVAQTLCRVLGLPASVHPAMDIALPAGCRYRRVAWGGGIRLNVPPRGIIWIRALFILIAAGVTAGLCIYIHGMKIGDDSIVSWGAILGLSLLMGVLIYWLLHRSLNAISMETAFFSSAHLFQAVQTGFFHPLDHRWESAQIKDIVLKEEPGVRMSLLIIPHSGMPLALLEGERRDDIQWAIAVLKAGLVPQARDGSESRAPVEPTVSNAPEPASK